MNPSRGRLVATLIAATLLLLMPTTVFAGRDIDRDTGNVNIAAGERVDSVNLLSGDVEIHGRVADTVSVLRGDVVVYPGASAGDVTVGMGSVLVKDGGRIESAVLGNGTMTVENGGLVTEDVKVLSGDVVAPADAIKGGHWTGFSAFDLDFWHDVDLDWGFTGWLAMTVLALLSALFVGALLPQVLRALDRQLVGDFWVSLAVGLSSVIWVPITIVILIVTLIGLIYLPFWIPAIAVGWIMGWLAAAYAIGIRVLRLDTPSRGQAVGACAVGVVALRAIDLIPWVGTLVNVLVSLAAFGAVTVAVAKSMGNGGDGDATANPVPSE